MKIVNDGFMVHMVHYQFILIKKQLIKLKLSKQIFDKNYGGEFVNPLFLQT